MERFKQMLRLQSNPKNVSRVEPFVDGLVEQFKISPDVYGNILITLTEAVTNAITHGNKEDESKTVCVQLKKENDRIAFMISDEGHGFDYTTVPDPTSPENILKIGGRGVFLMKELSDDINFYDEGRTVEIQFKI